MNYIEQIWKKQRSGGSCNENPSLEKTVDCLCSAIYNPAKGTFAALPGAFGLRLVLIWALCNTNTTKRPAVACRPFSMAQTLFRAFPFGGALLKEFFRFHRDPAYEFSLGGGVTVTVVFVGPP